MQIRGIAETLSGQETRHLDASRRILKLQLNDREIGVAWTGEAMAATDGGHDRGRLARHQRFDTT